MKLTFIVSTFNRPDTLANMLACLNLQTEKDFEVVVTDNSDDPIMARRNKFILEQYDTRFRYLKTSHNNPYSSAEEGVSVSTGDYLAFPSDDDYLVPHFAEFMIWNCERNRLDFTYSDGVYEPWKGKSYGLFETSPEVNRIDKCSFIMRRKHFTEFPHKSKVSTSDGYLIEALVKQGLRHAKTNGILWVHN